jgi:hypothetical protein
MHAPARTRTDARLAQGIRANAQVHAHMFTCTHEHSTAHSTALTAEHSQQARRVRAPRLRTPAVAFHVRRTPEHHEARNMQHGARYQVSTQSTPCDMR